MTTPHEGHDLSKMRVSTDDAISEVTKARAQLAKTKRELAAVTKDRDGLLVEFEDLRKASYPQPPSPRPKAAKKDDFVRVICGDVHGCVMDRPAVEAFLADLRKWQPDEVVLLGDIVECGGFLAAHHTLGYVAQTAYSWQDDIAAGIWFLDEVQKAAPGALIHYLEGNHEDRVERWIVDQTMRHSRDAEFLRRMIAPDVLLNLQGRGINFYRRGEETLPGLPPGWIKLGKVFFVHELGGGKNAASSAVGRTAGNVVFGHTHREDTSTMVMPGVGLVKAWNPGCLCQRQPLWRHSDPTGWSHGYAVQFVSRSGEFLHLQIPIWEGRSLVGSMHDRVKA
jgi:predicted phosphodiesterase